MHTPEFYRHFLDYVPVGTLMWMRLVNKELRVITEQFVLAGKMRGVFIVHDRRDGDPGITVNAIKEMHRKVTQMIFLLNITQVGERSCEWAVNLVVVDFPEGVTSMSKGAFGMCYSLTTVSFPTTLRLLGREAFFDCSSLDNVDLLHTNLQEFGGSAFNGCSELKTTTIPDTLQTLGAAVFFCCSKLVPSSTIDINDEINGDDVTPEVVELLQERSKFATLEIRLSEQFSEKLSKQLTK
ncbi:hypothetical protein TrLO_g4032 [Triparma laevis f. longispina]|uniref:Uncharacterized protein n=1 Tax=Triparma laevis f. longispina TaxID=1714387 RepID=A0A9W7AVF1_9STRA|nr:hypothetical protein TrLO_g4032 [Triparma laevis f. longispina]